jgi:hypothetical protein
VERGRRLRREEIPFSKVPMRFSKSRVIPRRAVGSLGFGILLAASVSAANPLEEVARLIDWSHSGLAAGAAAMEEGRTADAMDELLRHFRAREQVYHFDPDEPLRDLNKIAQETHDTSTLEDVMRRRFTFEQETVEFEEGIDWRHRIYDPEWAFMLHRHTHFRTLVEGYRRTGDERFMREFAWQLREWDRQVESTHPRTLEVGLRLAHWTRLFPVAVHSEHFDVDLLALFLGNVHRMAESLNNRESGYRRGNWGMMEATGVLLAGTYFPELAKASAWRETTMALLPGHFLAATSVDGVYRGRSPHYHNVVLRQAFEFLRLLEINGRAASPEFLAHHHRMLDFAAAYARPDLSMPQFGDSDDDPMRERLLQWGRAAQRPDLLYIASDGREGEQPAWTDRLFLEGGFCVLRSEWADGRDARWLMFDFGPNGRGQLRIGSVDIAAYGRPLISMPGRYRYRTQDDSRALFISTPFQNTVSIDGKNQHPNPPRGLSRHKMDGQLKVLHAWHEGYTHLAEGADSPIVHERQVVMVRDAFWIIADQVRAPEGRSFSYAQNWRFQPTTLRALEGFDGGFVSSYPEANIAVIPLAGAGRAVERENGWYSPQYGVRYQAPWLAFEQQDSDEGFLIFTLLAPFPGDSVLLGEVRVVRVDGGIEARLEWKDGFVDEISIRFGAAKGEGRNRWTGWHDGVALGAEELE